MAFVLLSGAVWHHGGVNPNSRFAALRAIVRHATFRIDRFRHWTIDRAMTPDGHFYSNKAPGPVLLAYPLAWALDRVGIDGNPGGGGGGPSVAYKTGLSLALQALPFALAVWLSDRALGRRGISATGRRFACLAALFGNTAVVFMNVFFGHGVAAWCMLGMALALVEQRFRTAGLLAGLAVLSDYAAAILAPLLLLCLPARPASGARALGQVLLGGLLPAGLFAFYHFACFGSPFATALHYQTPLFANEQQVGLARVLAPWPSLDVLRELTVGPSRGILYTQPWVYTVFGASVLLWRRRPLPRPLLVMTLIGLPLLLVFNARFNGWHGGGSAGPRYLALLFPVFALLSAFVYDAVGTLGRALFWATLVPAIALRGLIYASGSPLFELVELWPYYVDELSRNLAEGHGQRLALFVGALVLTSAIALGRGEQQAQASMAEQPLERSG